MKIRYAMRNGIPKIVNMRGGKIQVRYDISNVTVRHDLVSKFSDRVRFCCISGEGTEIRIQLKSLWKFSESFCFS